MTEVEISPTPKKVRPVAHLLVNDRVVRRPFGAGPSFELDHPYRVDLFDTERVYQREQDVGPEWASLDLGWVKDPVLIVLTTCGRTETGVVTVGVRIDPPNYLPDPEIGGEYRESTPERPNGLPDGPGRPEFAPFGVLFPGRSVRTAPVPGAVYGAYTTSPDGPVRVTVTAFPR